MTIKIFTIGFTKKSAERFFELLRNAGVRRVIDTRLNRKSQLAGFAKETDLPFLLREIAKVEYVQEPITAPTNEMLIAYKAGKMDWPTYEKQYRALIADRRVASKLDPSKFDDACLLCSEDKPHYCHRRLLAEYLKDHWQDVDVHHL